MILDYELITFLHNEGYAYKWIWEAMSLPVKYSTFESAVMHYNKTGKKRKLQIRKKDLWNVPPTILMDDYDFGTRMEELTFKMDESLNKVKELVETTPYPSKENKTKEEILSMLKKGCIRLDINDDPLTASKIVEELRSDGYLIDEVLDQSANVKYMLGTNTKKTENHIHKKWDGSRHLRIGVVSDTHIGNVNNQMTFLQELYDRFEEAGITDVYHAGDVTDGWYPNRSDQVYELHSLGADNQVNYVCEHYPKREGITTHFIIGNHDYTFIRNTGYNIGPAIAMKRPDMKYLGAYNARVWLTPNCDMELNHPGDGSSYAMSYSIQKYIDSLSGGDKPKILINGHHHKFLTMFYRNIHAIECPCTEAQTPFMKSKRLAAHMGGLILDIYVTEDGTIDRFNVELIPLYKARKNDY